VKTRITNGNNQLLVLS